MAKKKFELGLKRAMDIVLSIVGLLILAAPFMIISIVIKLGSKGSVFFRQERVGKDGELFKPWKFRTMVENAEEKGLGYQVKEDDSRITLVGAFLREWGLDELPQLLNVLKGEMSIVGPRPTLEYQVEQYDDFQRRRLEVKPGITGWALIHGRNKLSWEERIEHDVWYVKNWSIWLDFKIIVKTLWVVLVTKEGVYGEGGINDGFVDNQSKLPEGNNGEDKVIIYGASGHGKVVKDVIEREGKYELLGFIDDNSDLKVDDNACSPIIGTLRLLKQGDIEPCKLILAIGENRGRKKLYTKINKLKTDFDYITAIHPSAEIAAGVNIGSGTVIMANTTVNTGTEIGSHAIVNTGATIDHDCFVGDFAHISPGVNLAGGVEVGELSHVGIGTSVIQGVKIGRDSVVGAGAAVVDNIPDGVVAVGIPAKVQDNNRGPN